MAEKDLRRKFKELLEKCSFEDCIKLFEVEDMECFDMVCERMIKIDETRFIEFEKGYC